MVLSNSTKSGFDLCCAWKSLKTHVENLPEVVSSDMKNTDDSEEPTLYKQMTLKKPYVCHLTSTAWWWQEMAEDGCKVISEPFFPTLSGEGMQTPPPKADFIKDWNCMKFYFAALYFLQWILFISSNLAKLLRFVVSYIPAFLSQTQQKITWTS